MERLDLFLEAARKFIADKFSHLSAEAVGWLAVVFIHCATIPSVLSLILGMSDKLPSLDVVMFAWGGLLLLFVRALIMRDMLNIITIGFGFFVQAFLLALVVFK
jgi:hypothetical protein